MPTLTLRTDKDAYVAEDAPEANHGAGPSLRVESKVLLTAANKRLLCSFDLRGLPASAARVVQATLRLFPRLRTPGRALRCHQVTSPWTETGVTWNTQPGVGADHGARSSDDDPQEWDVTGSARAAFPGGRAEFRVKDDAEGSLLAKVQEYPARERPGPAAELVVLYEEQREADLGSRVRPRVRRAAHLHATMHVRLSGSADLASRVRPRVRGLAEVVSSVRPRLRRVRSLFSVVRVGGPEPGPETARPSDPTRERLAAASRRDFRAISEEAGSTIQHTSGGSVRTLRRVVHIVDTRETQAFPRAVTSEQGKPSTQDQLRRGDAVLYALGDDAFRPGDTVEWQGRTWAVAGLLGVEMVGDVEVYQEVGLRRLAVVVRGRLQGVVEVVE